MKSIHQVGFPVKLQPLFWDCSFATLTWDKDRDFIIGRILTSGDWRAVIWLRSAIEDAAIREWLERHRGGGISPKRLRFWELILDLSHRQVNVWLATKGRQVWDRRTHP